MYNFLKNYIYYINGGMCILCIFPEVKIVNSDCLQGGVVGMAVCVGGGGQGWGEISWTQPWEM